jgi:CubicO group peptidase (beta-lactamase class C family)
MNVKLHNVSVLRIALLAIVCLFSATGYAEDLRRTKAEKVGMSSARLERLEELNQKYVEEGKLAGVMTMVARHGKIVHVSAAGTYGVDNDKPLTEDTLFRIYSMTKPITAVALMMLYEEGAFQLSDPVSKFLPQFKNMQVWKQDHPEDAQGQITMHQLLTHTAGLSYGAGKSEVDQAYQEADLLRTENLDEFIEKVAKLPLVHEPGERWTYGLSYDVLGAVAEKISGQNYAEFLKARIFDPLEMDDTFFYLPDDKGDRFPTNHVWNDETSELAVFPDDDPLNHSYYGSMFYAGGHGLVSTIGDYMKFLEMLRSGGSMNGVRLLSPKTIQFMTTNHLPAATSSATSGASTTLDLPGVAKGLGFGIGFGVFGDPAIAGIISSPGTYFWGGHAGTIFWVDPEEDLVAIGMLQLIASPWPYRNEMMVATYQAIEELNRGK